MDAMDATDELIGRRYFLKQGGIALAGLGGLAGVPGVLARAVDQTAGDKKRVLIVIFQRGAMDGLSAVVPHGDAEYYKLRPNLAIPRPKRGGTGGVPTDTAIDLDGHFGLHPSLAPLKPLFDSKELAIVHAVGSPDQTRSHFDAQDYMESGTPGVKSTSDGWLNRTLVVTPDSRSNPFRAVAMGTSMPRVLQGKATSLALGTLAGFALRGGGPSGMAGGPNQAQSGFESMYGEAVNGAMRGAGRETFEAVNLLQRVNPRQYQPLAGVQYPRGLFGDRLRQIAQLVKSGIGLEIAFTDIGGWDTHANQGATQGQLANRLAEFSQGLAALYNDLRASSSEFVILTMTEFGRTAGENGNRGTDHGHASTFFMLGGSLDGGKVHGRWPGLRQEQLFEGRDLAVTTDFREILGQILGTHLGVNDLGRVLPGYAPRQDGPRLFTRLS